MVLATAPATDFEHADAPSTGQQREVLALTVAGADRYDRRWKTLATGPLAALGP